MEKHIPKTYAPSVYIESWLIQVPDSLISSSAKILYGRLSQWSSTAGIVKRTVRQLSEETGMEKRKVDRLLKELRNLKLIGTAKKEFSGPNSYEFYKHEWMELPIHESLCYNKKYKEKPEIINDDKSDVIDNKKDKEIPQRPNKINNDVKIDVIDTPNDDKIDAPMTSNLSSLKYNININNSPSIVSPPFFGKKSEEEEKFNVSDDGDKVEEKDPWLSINFSYLSSIGFDYTHILQIKGFGKMTPLQVQNSINNLAKAITKGTHIKSPLNYFMTLMKNGSVFVVTESQADINADHQQRRYEYETTKYQEEKKKSDLVAKEITEFREAGGFEVFDEWYKKLSDEEKEKGCPLKSVGGLKKMQEIIIRQKYMKMVREEMNKDENNVQNEL